MKIFIKLMVYIVLTGNFMGCKQDIHTDTMIKGIKFYPEHSRCTNAEICARSIHDAGFNVVFMSVREKDVSDRTEFDLHAFRREQKKNDNRFYQTISGYSFTSLLSSFRYTLPFPSQ